MSRPTRAAAACVSLSLLSHGGKITFNRYRYVAVRHLPSARRDTVFSRGPPDVVHDQTAPLTFVALGAEDPSELYLFNYE